jgi:PEP-CTERM motif
MKIESLIFRLCRCVCGTAAILIVVISTRSFAQGVIVWNGPTITYTQPSPDPTQAADQDRLTSDVWLTRGASQGLFNAATESSYTHYFSPADTEWAYGELADYSTLTYTNWEGWFGGVNGGGPPTIVGKDAVLYLVSDNIYLSIKFISWGGPGGGFSYMRSTPSPVPEPAVFPLLGIGLAAISRWRFRRGK